MLGGERRIIFPWLKCIYRTTLCYAGHYKESDVKIIRSAIGGTIAGQNFIYAHLNRVINKYDLNMFYIEGPGHGAK